MYTEKHLIELFNDHDYRESCIQFCMKKTKCDKLYTILQKKLWDRYKGHGSDRTPAPVSDRKKKFLPTLLGLYVFFQTFCM